jgi:fumarate reductase subunit D
MLGHFFHLAVRSFLAIPNVLGSTWAGILFPVLVLLIGEVIGASLFGWKAMLNNRKKATGVGLAALGIGYTLLFLWCAAFTTYTDHEALVAINRALQNRQINNPYEKSFIGSYAYTNTVGAFGYLVRDPSRQPDQDSPCQIKITSGLENKALLLSLRSVATAVGCNVLQEPYNPETDSEAWAEINQSLPNFLVIHGAKGNASADGFVADMSTTFRVQRAYSLPPKSRDNLLWLQIGTGSVWRDTK